MVNYVTLVGPLSAIVNDIILIKVSDEDFIRVIAQDIPVKHIELGRVLGIKGFVRTGENQDIEIVALKITDICKGA